VRRRARPRRFLQPADPPGLSKLAGWRRLGRPKRSRRSTTGVPTVAGIHPPCSTPASAWTSLGAALAGKDRLSSSRPRGGPPGLAPPAHLRPPAGCATPHPATAQTSWRDALVLLVVGSSTSAGRSRCALRNAADAPAATPRH
jgi:hypothetical protein